MKKMILIPLVFLKSLAFAQDAAEKTRIEVDDLNYIELIESRGVWGQISEAPKIKRLAEKEYEEFTKRWNAATFLGADKYEPEYLIDVYLKDGKKRRFIVSGRKIQESGWMTFDIGEGAYFEQIWETARQE